MLRGADGRVSTRRSLPDPPPRQVLLGQQLQGLVFWDPVFWGFSGTRFGILFTIPYEETGDNDNDDDDDYGCY